MVYRKKLEEIPEEEKIEELDEIMKKTEREFKMGNSSASNYYSSPKEMLDEYRDFE